MGWTGRISQLAQSATQSLIAFKKVRENHPLIALSLGAIFCAGIGATLAEWTLPLRGKMVIDATSYSPSLSARGLWDHDHPSPKAVELARLTAKEAVAAIEDSSVPIKQRAMFVELISEVSDTSARCSDLSSKALAAFGTTASMAIQADADACYTMRRRSTLQLVCLLQMAGHPVPDIKAPACDSSGTKGTLEP